MDNFLTYHPSIAHSTEQTFNQPVHYDRLYVLGIKRRRHHEPCLQCNLILEVIECWENNGSREKKEIDLIGTNLRRLLGGVDILNWSLKMNENVLLAESGWRGKRQQRKWWEGFWKLVRLPGERKHSSNASLLCQGLCTCWLLCLEYSSQIFEWLTPLHSVYRLPARPFLTPYLMFLVPGPFPLYHLFYFLHKPGHTVKSHFCMFISLFIYVSQMPSTM